MPYSISIDDALRAVVLRAWGAGSHQEGTRAFDEALGTAREHGLSALVIDILELDYVPSNAEASILSGKLGAHGGNRLSVGIIAPPGAPFDRARVVGTLTELLGARVRVFESRDAVESWLRP